MKNNQFTFVVLMLILISSACTTDKLSVTVIRDVTDSGMAYPKSEEVNSIFDIKGNTWRGIDFQFTLIADVEYGPEYDLHLLGRNFFHSNELERKREIGNFRNKIDSLLAIPQKPSREYSVVFPVVIREATRLMKNPASKKVLVIYSDLIENTDTISLVKLSAQKAIQRQGAGLWTQLEQIYQTQLPSNLNGLDIYLVYQAKDLYASSEFKAISGLYRQQLEQRGARVMITSKL